MTGGVAPPRIFPQTVRDRIGSSVTGGKIEDLRERFMRASLLTLLLILISMPASAAERWETLLPTPAPIASDRSGQAEVNGVSIHYSIYGHGSPVIFLHGGLANADYWGNQVLPVAAHHTVILMDSRGHGRSTRDMRPYGYDLMADDVVALMDQLKIAKADIVGWSDGGILGIDLAMRHSDRVGKIFRLRSQYGDFGRQGRRREESDLRGLYRARRPRIPGLFGDT